MGELGLFGCCFPESVGGTGAGFVALAAVAEQLAWVYPPLTAAMNLQAATVPLTIANWGTAEQVARWVPALIAGEALGANAMTEPDGGSDLLGAMRTRAVRDGNSYVINGAKLWITNGNVADVALVYAKTDPSAGHRGVSAFVVPTDTPGFEARRVPCRGLGSLMPTTSISFTDVRVPASALLGAEGEGFTVAMNAMDYGRLTCLGPRGRPRPGLPRRRALLRRHPGRLRGEDRQLPDGQEATGRHDLRGRGRPRARPGRGRGIPRGYAARPSSIAKYYAADVANRAAQATAVIFGGMAFSDELPIGLYLNYAKLWQTGEGSAKHPGDPDRLDALGWKDMDRHVVRRRPLEG